jgi:aspartate/methionine/tyrosine aminotransferase
MHDRYCCWNEWYELGEKYNCVSLGQGSPDLGPPKFLVEELKKVMEVPANNNYGRPNGHPELVKVISEIYSKKIGRVINPMTEVIVSQGANGILNTVMQAMTGPGDEIVLFTPLFPVYDSQVELAGATISEVPLRFDGTRFVFDPDELRAALKRP